jgi:ribonuclease PH
VRSTEHNTHVHVVCVAAAASHTHTHTQARSLLGGAHKSEVNMQPRYTPHTRAQGFFQRGARRNVACAFAVALLDSLVVLRALGEFLIFFLPGQCAGWRLAARTRVI